MDALYLFHRYRDDVYRLAVNYTGSASEAENISRSVFLGLVGHGELTPGTERDFLMQAAADECRRCFGIWKRSIPGSTPPDMDKIRQGIMSLPPKYRVVMYLRYYEDLTTGEIARLLRISQSTAASRLSRGRGQLENKLRKMET